MSGSRGRSLDVHATLRVLRVVAIVAPVLFAIGVGLLTDRVLETDLGEFRSRVAATAIVAAGALIFSLFIFALLERAYQRLEEHQQALERQAGELKALTEAEHRRAEEWKALFELGREVTASPDLEEVLASVVARARSLLSTDVAVLMLLSPEGDEVRMAASAGLHSRAMRSLRLPREHGVPGLVLDAGRPVIVADCRQDRRLGGRATSLVEEEGLVSVIGVPFSGKGKLLGTLVVGNRRPTEFDEHQAELLEAFANWAAVAVETSRLYEKVEALARLEERERIGMDLHDGVIQSIYAVALNLEDCLERLEESPQEVRSRLNKAMDDLNRVIAEIRSYIFDLRPQVQDASDLPRALGDLVRDVRVNTLLDAELEVEGELDGLLSQEQAEALFHIAREALNNAGRHARATSVRVDLRTDGDRLRLEVRDNGVGFDPEAATGPDKQGLRNMRERARHLGAHLAIESARGQGTRVAVELPLRSQEG